MGSDPMPMHESMTMPLLPQWLAITWAVVLVGVTAVHVWHAWAMRGQPRWWHIGHTTMALGMAAMYLLPAMSHPGFARFGLTAFGVISLGVMSTAVLHWWREGVANPLWLATTVDMLAMTYMFLPMANWIPVITGVLVGYLCLQTIAWATNLWARIPLYAGNTTTSGTPAVTDGPGTANSRAFTSRVGLTAITDGSVRATLAIMAAGMAYMLLAM